MILGCQTLNCPLYTVAWKALIPIRSPFISVTNNLLEIADRSTSWNEFLFSLSGSQAEKTTDSTKVL